MERWALVSGLQGDLDLYEQIQKELKQQRGVANLFVLGDLIGSQRTCNALLERLRQPKRADLQPDCIYGWWEEQLGQSPLTTFHYKQMLTAHRDLDLLIGKGQSTLEAVRTAIEMIQTQLQQARNEREQWFQIILAGAAVAFAVSALMDAEAADALIKGFMPFLADNPYRQLLVKLLISLLLTLIIALGYYVRRKKSP